MRNKCWFLLFLYLFVFKSIFSIENKFDYLNPENGLSANTVLSIFQDSRGFIWIGTLDGLNRYDGYTIKVFKSDEKDTLSINNNQIKDIVEDKYGRLWIGAQLGGFSIYFPDKNIFKRISGYSVNGKKEYLGEILHLAVSPDNKVLVMDANAGIVVFDENFNSVDVLGYNPKNPGYIPEGRISDVKFDKKGNWWFPVGNSYLCKYDPVKKTVKSYMFDTVNSGNGDIIKALHIDENNIIWIGTPNSGIFSFDPQNNQFSNYDIGNEINVSKKGIVCINGDNNGNIYFGTDGEGLICYDRNTKKWEIIKNVLSNPKSLSANSVYSIFIDRSKVLWVGTYSAGVNYYSQYKYKFIDYKPNPFDENSLSNGNVCDIMEDKEGIIWLGTDGGGMDSFDPVTKIFTNYKANMDDPNGLHTNVVIHLFQDKNGEILIGSYNQGLTIFNKETGVFRQYLPNPEDPTSISGIHPWFILRDSFDTLWIGYMAAGIDFFDIETGQLIRNFSSISNDPSSLSNSYINVIFEDSYKNIWVGTSNGLNKYNRKKGNFTQFLNNPEIKTSISNNIIYAIFEDSKRNLWVGTASGLNKMDRKKQTFKSFSTNEGLPSSVIYGIHEDNYGFIWISSGNGIAKFNPINQSFKNYDMSNGLQGKEFNYTASIRASDGEIYFGGKKGFNVFDPSKINDNPFKPNIVLTDFQIFNKSYEVWPVKEKGKKVYQSISYIKKIKLSYKQNVIRFEFTALDYSNPSKNVYKYKLENFEENWNEATADKRFASYTNLDGGKYIFKVVASNGDGIWNEEPLTIELIITPPIWKRTWFILFILIGIGYLARVIIKKRDFNIKKEKKYFEEKVEKSDELIKEKIAEVEQQKEEIRMRDIQEKDMRFINVGLAKFAEIISRQKDDLYKLSQNVISELVTYIEAQQGLIFLFNEEDNPLLELTGYFGCDETRLEKKYFNISEGYVGASFKDNEVIYIDNLPEGYTTISTGLGNESPSHLVEIPISFDIIKLGVIELSSFYRIDNYKIEFVKKMCETLASIISSTKSNEKFKKMIEHNAQQTEELQAQEEEMRQNMEELQATQEELERQLEKNNKIKDGLIKEKALLDSIMGTLPDYIYFKDKESKFIRISNSMLKLFPVKKLEEMIGKSDFNFQPKESAQIYYDQEQNIIKTGKGIIDEVNHEMMENGVEQWVSTTKMPLIDETGKCIGTFGISKDVTSLKKLEMEAKVRTEELLAQEEELRQNLEELQATQDEISRIRETEQELMRKLESQNEALKMQQEELEKEKYLMDALMQNLPEHIYFKDHQSRFIKFSHSMLKLFNLNDKKDLLGKSDLDFFDEAHARPAFENEMKIIKTGKAMVDLIEKEVHKDGSTSWVNTTKMPLKDLNGKTVGTFGISKDITRIKLMEENASKCAEELEKCRKELKEASKKVEELKKKIK